MGSPIDDKDSMAQGRMNTDDDDGMVWYGNVLFDIIE